VPRTQVRGPPEERLGRGPPSSVVAGPSRTGVTAAVQCRAVLPQPAGRTPCAAPTPGPATSRRSPSTMVARTRLTAFLSRSRTRCPPQDGLPSTATSLWKGTTKPRAGVLKPVVAAVRDLLGKARDAVGCPDVLEHVLALPMRLPSGPRTGLKRVSRTGAGTGPDRGPRRTRWIAGSRGHDRATTWGRDREVCGRHRFRRHETSGVS
jgi:hypothetical protein